MPRRRRPEKRQILPDPKFNDMVVAKFVNNLMKRGKRSTAERLFYKALDQIEAKVQKPGLDVFKKAVSNAEPVLEVKSRRVGGATYQVPVEIPYRRKQALAFRWLIAHAKGRAGKTMSEKLAMELMDAFNNQGGAIKKKEDTHKMAEANRAFAHFKW